MAQGKRIQSDESAAFERVELDSLSDGTVVRASAARRDRQREREEARRDARDAPPPSLEEQLLDGIRQGAWSASVTAENLERVVREAAEAGREEGYAEGREAGYRDGYEAGLAAGRDAGSAEVTDARQRLERILDNLLAPVAAQEDELQAVLGRLVIQVAREVVRRELVTDPMLIRQVIREAIAAMPVGAANVRVFLNPDDHALMQTVSSTALRREDWQLEVDTDLERGDCRVEHGQSLIQWSTEQRFNDAIEDLFGSGSR